MSSKKKSKTCSHVVSSSIYERNAPEIGSWWNKLFRMLEEDAAIPPDKRLEVVKDIFPSKILNEVLSILSFVKNDERERDLAAGLKKQESVESCATICSCCSESEDKYKRREIGASNPYTRFFKQRPDRAAIWHPLPPLSLDEMNLIQKAHAITERIATEFVKWMQNISDEDSPTCLTVPLVLKMFQIGFNTHAAKSLQVRVKELASVPDGVALLKNLPDMSKRSQLHIQLRRDLKASRKQKKVFAFSTKLDPDEQIHPPKAEDIEKWLVCRRVPKKLESMAAVWQGITHLRSTKAFCQYLLKHPEITPPKYLVQMNMMDDEMLRQPRYSMDFDTGITAPSRIFDFS